MKRIIDNKKPFFMFSQVIRVCAVCGIEYKRESHKSGIKYCSEKCRNKVEGMAYRLKRDKMMKDGIVNGRPIKDEIYLRYQKSAKKREKSFNLTQDQFNSFWGLPCYYCASQIRFIGLDRVDNSIGYEIDNLVPCCTECNLMKRGISSHGFIAHCIKIASKFIIPFNRSEPATTINPTFEPLSTMEEHYIYS